MTIIWFIYYTIILIKNKDETDDDLLIFPSLIIDSIIISILGYFKII